MFNNFNKKGIKLKYQKVYQFMIAVFTVCQTIGTCFEELARVLRTCPSPPELPGTESYIPDTETEVLPMPACLYYFWRMKKKTPALIIKKKQ